LATSLATGLAALAKAGLPAETHAGLATLPAILPAAIATLAALMVVAAATRAGLLVPLTANLIMLALQERLVLVMLPAMFGSAILSVLGVTRICHLVEPPLKMP
jgi:hypothetical protein